MASLNGFRPWDKSTLEVEPAGRALPWLKSVTQQQSIESVEADSKLDYALRYASIGWHVLPLWWAKKDGACACNKSGCSNIGKHPISELVPRGQNDATTDDAKIRYWFKSEPEANIGVFLAPSGLVAIDIDPRNGGVETMEDIEARHGKIQSGIMAITGGGGEHRVFMAPKGGSLPGMLGAGIDVKMNGYIVVEPSNHASGQSYMWDASSDPLDGAVADPLPDWLRDLAVARQSVDVQTTPCERFVTEQQISELESALTAISADEYHDWINVGQALRSIGPDGFRVWDAWSQSSDKYKAQQQGLKWRGFKPGAFNIESIFHMAQKAGWVNPLAVITEVRPSIKPSKPTREISSSAITTPKIERNTPQPFPSHLTTIPGVLGKGVQWFLDTANKPQPVYAVQSMLALGSVVLGRKYRTTHANWSSLYFMVIGKSSTGKEYVKAATERVLEAADLAHLIGPGKYASEQGMLSSLIHQSCGVAIQDEFGKVLEAAKTEKGSQAKDVMRLMMETWGRCDGTIRATAYSTAGMTQTQQDALRDRYVVNPALTFVGMSTSEVFYDALGSGSVRDGFLNRFLLAECHADRIVSRFPSDIPPPTELLEWCKAQRAVVVTGGNLESVETSQKTPIPMIVPFSVAAKKAFSAFDQHCIDRMNDLEKIGMAEMFGRTNEIAMRLSLIVARSCGASVIELPHAEWGIDYALHCAIEATRAAGAATHEGEFDAAAKDVERLLSQSNERGITERELRQRSRKLARLSPRAQKDILALLAQDGVIEHLQINLGIGHVGKKRVAWVFKGHEE